MTTKELISKLEKLPPNAPVVVYWDGGIRSSVKEVFLLEKNKKEPWWFRVDDSKICVALVDLDEMEYFYQDYPSALFESDAV